MNSNKDDTLVVMKGVTKNYAGVIALDTVDFIVGKGEAVCLVGENGSGKSTLIKILAGVEQASSGFISIAGKSFTALNPRSAAAAGVMVVFQDFSLFPNLTVAENIAFSTQLGQHYRLFNKTRVRKIAEETLLRVGVDIDLNARVESLPVAHKQLVGICRGLASNARLIIMDEPTTALTAREVRILLDIIRRLKNDGIAVIFVSHKLAEVLEVSEKVVILRNGKKVAEGPAGDFDAASLTRNMTGRDVADGAPNPITADAPVLLSVKNLRKEGAIDDVSFDLHKGEVLGISGLLGSGRTSLAKALFGLVKVDSGSVELDGEMIPLGNPLAAAAQGIGYVPEDRLTEGLFLAQSIMHNVAIGRLDHHQSAGLLDLQGLWGDARDWVSQLKIKAQDLTAPVNSLSGGNQQRAVLARWLSRAPRVLILNGPSVGVDVGSKSEIHDIIRSLATSGIGIIVISDDIQELLSTCQRILVMKSGRVSDDLIGGDTSELDLAQRLAS